MSIVERVSVIGTSGSGKTTLARSLAIGLEIPHLELDSVFHQPGWVQLPDPEFRERIADFIRGDRWVVDGNYTSHGVSDLVWPRADTIIWLDLPRPTVMRQVTARTIGRAVRRAELWNGNREPFRNFFDPRPEQNIVLWAWTRHTANRRKFEDIARGGSWSHATVHRLRSRNEVDRFLDQLQGHRR